MAVNPTDLGSYSPAQQQQQPQKRGGSKAQKAIANGVILGGTGAVLGATVFVPRTVNSAGALMDLENDTFQSTLGKIPDKASAETKEAKEAFTAMKADIERIQASNLEEVKKIFPDEKVTEIGVDDAVKAYAPKEHNYSSLAEAKAKIPQFEAQVKSRIELVKALSAKEGTKIKRDDLAKLIAQSGYEGDAAEMAKKATLSKWNPLSWFGGTKVKADDVIRKITDGKIANANDFKTSIKAEKAELTKFIGLLEDPTLVKGGKLTREAYMTHLEGKNKLPELSPEAETAFKKLIKKYMPKNRTAGAIKVGLIGLGAGVLVGLLTGRSNKEKKD